jgi:hypothetical protein
VPKGPKVIVGVARHKLVVTSKAKPVSIRIGKLSIKRALLFFMLLVIALLLVTSVYVQEAKVHLSVNFIFIN